MLTMLSLGDKDVLLATSRQGFKFCTWFISSKMYRSTEHKNSKST